MTDSTPPPLTVVALQASNFKRLRAVQLAPSPTGLVEVRGRNGEGKSSLLDALAAALGGKRSCPSQPIHSGEDAAEVVADLGGLVVRRRWTDPADPQKSYLTVENGEGARYPSPQALLDGLVGRFADPVRFLGLPEQEQIREVLQMVDLGVDLPASRKQEAELAARRKALRSATESLEARLDGLLEEAVDQSGDLVDEKQADAARQLLAQDDEARQRHEAAIQRARAAEAEETHLNSAWDMATGEVQRITQEIDRLQAQLETARQKANEIHGKIQEAEKATQAALTAVDAIQPRLADEAREELNAVIERAKSQEQIRAQQAAIEARGKEVQDQLAASREELEQTQQAIEEVRQQRKDALAAIQFPVDGMAFDGSQILLNGVPFSQASQAERLSASAELAMAQSPRIRVMFARDGSLLDEAHKAQLAEIVERHGWQLWLEVVDDQAEGPGVFIEDGTAITAETVKE